LELPTLSSDLQQISIPLKIGVHVQDEDHYLHGNITHLTTLMDAPFVGSGKVKPRCGSSLVCKEGCRFSMGCCMREPYCPLSSAGCNATVSTLPLFEMAESACSSFCYVLHLFIKFISAFYSDWTVAVAQYT
jgi:hypothetical protein